VVLAFLGAEGKLTRFGDFNRVAGWIDSGAPGAKVNVRGKVRPAPKVGVEIAGKVEE
jgi:hypothetical protein